MGRTLFCDDTCDECVRHGGAGIARLARPRRHLVVEDAALNASVEEANLWLQQIYNFISCAPLENYRTLPLAGLPQQNFSEGG